MAEKDDYSFQWRHFANSFGMLFTAVAAILAHVVELFTDSSKRADELRKDNRERSRVDEDVRNLTQSLKLRVAAANLLDREAFNSKFFDEATDYQVERGGLYPAKSIWAAHLDVSWKLLKEEELERIDPPEYNDEIGKGRYVDYLVAQAEKLKDPAKLMGIFIKQTVHSFLNIKNKLPDSAFTFGKDGIEKPSFATVPLLDVISDLPELIMQAIHPYYMPKPRELGLFKALERQIQANDARAGGELPEPENFKGTRKQRLDAYLGGTALRDFFDVQVPFGISMDDRGEHTAIVAGSGWGKTQLLQAIIANDLLADDPPSIVVIDSTGAMIERIQRLAVFNDRLKDRLLVINPEVNPVPALNPFDISNPRFDNYDENVRERMQSEIVNLFNYVFSTIKNPLTARMETAFAFMVRLMISIPKANIRTLLELLDDDPPKGDYEKAIFKPQIERLDETTRHFFKVQYYTGKDGGLREQIRARVFDIIKEPSFERMFSTVNKLDLFTELNRGAVVLVNTSENLLKDSSATFGRYIIARCMAAAFERASLAPHQRKQTFLIVDEAAPYFDETFEKLLNRVRQFKLGVVIAFQNLDQASEKLRSTIGSSTAVKFAGGNVVATDARWLAREMRCEPEFIMSQKRDGRPPKWAQFACHVSGHAAVSVTVPFLQLENMPKMSDQEHEAMLARNRSLVSSPPPLRSEPRPAPPAAPAQKAKPPQSPPDDDAAYEYR